MAIKTVPAPSQGIWRIGRGPDPLQFRPPAENRFDSITGTYSVLYFATELEGCYGETLARFRPDPKIEQLISREWDELGFMAVGSVPADWRVQRQAVKVKFPRGSRFLDIEAMPTREVLRTELADLLALHGHNDFDVALARGPHRAITRAASEWSHWQTDENGIPRYAGIRYLSRLNSDWECWAVFDRTPITPVATKPVFAADEPLKTIAKTYKLRVY